MAARKKERNSPLFTNLPEVSDDRTDSQIDTDEALDRLERLEWDDIHQKDRELQKTFQEIDEAQKSRIGIKYDSRQKLRAALAYIVTASSGKASQLTGIPSQTIRYWKQEAPWWPVAVKYALAAQREELDAKLGELVSKGLDGALSGMDRGDPVITRKKFKDEDGIWQEKVVIEYVPLKAKDLMAIASAARDKQAVLRGEPTSITEKKTDKEVLDDVARKLAETISQHQAPKGIVGTFNSKGERVDE